MDSFDFSIDDFDWSKPASSEPVGSPPPAAAAPEETPPPTPAPPPPEPAAPAGRGGSYDIPQELLPKAYREYKGDQYKRKRPGSRALDFSIDEFDYGGGETAAPAAASDDWAITRGAKEAYSGGVNSITTMADMQRIASMSTEAEQRAAMIELGKKVGTGPSQLREPNIEGIGGVGEFFTWLGESAGQMIGSMGAAAYVGGGTGALAGAGVGGAAGSLAGGAGALPGAFAGGVAGAGYGTMAAFGAMGIGGMYNDLLSDKGVQEGLANGTIAPSTILASAVGAGAIIGALDAVPANRLFKGLTGEVSQEAVKKGILELAKKGIKGGLKTAAEEGITEGAQGAVSELGQAIIGGNADVFERSMSVINQTLAGAVGGFGPGAASGGYNQIRAPGIAAPAPPAGEEAPPEDPANVPNNPAGGVGSPPPAPPRGPARRPGENYGKTDTETLPGEGVQVVGDGAIPSDIAAATDSADEAELDETFGVGEDDTFGAAAPAGIARGRRAAPTQTGSGDAALDAALAGVSPQAQNAPVLPGAPTQAAVAEGEPAADLQTPLPAGPSAQKQRAIQERLARIKEKAAAGAFPGPGEFTQGDPAAAPAVADPVAAAPVEAAPVEAAPAEDIAARLDATLPGPEAGPQARQDWIWALLNGPQEDMDAYAASRQTTPEKMRAFLDNEYTAINDQLAEQVRALPEEDSGFVPEQGPRFSSTVDYTVQTEDQGAINIRVMRAPDGSALMQDMDSGQIIEHNAAFADGKSDEDLLAYSFEPAGYQGAAPTEAAPAGAEQEQEAAPDLVEEEDPVVSTFTTAKGSTYEVHASGKTTRNKAYRPEHGEKEQGPQPRSEATYYVTPEDAQKLGEVQTQGDNKAIIHRAGQLGMMYSTGRHQGKIERRTVVNAQPGPAPGLVPVELWDDGNIVHFGNQIVEHAATPAKAPPKAAAAKRKSRKKQAAPEPELTPAERLAQFAAGVSAAVLEEEEAQAELEANPPADKQEATPVKTKGIGPYHAYKESDTPTARKFKKRAKAKEEAIAKQAKHKAAKERRAAAGPLARVALADALARYDTLSEEEQEIFRDSLSESASERLRLALAGRRTPQPPTQRVEAKPAKRPEPKKAEPVARGKAATIKPVPASKKAEKSTLTPEESVTVNVTSNIFQNLVNKMGSGRDAVEAAVKTLIDKGAKVLDKATRKVVGSIEDVVFEGKPPKLKPAPRKPRGFKMGGKTYTSIKEFENDLNTARLASAGQRTRLTKRLKKVREIAAKEGASIGEPTDALRKLDAQISLLKGKIDNTKIKERGPLNINLKKMETRRRNMSEAIWEPSDAFKKADAEITRIEKKLEQLEEVAKPFRDVVENNKNYKELKRWTDAWLNRPTPKGEAVEEGLIKLSFLDEAISRADLFAKYAIETATTRLGIATVAPTKSVRDRAVEAMQAHFAKSDQPVKLKPLLFSTDEIAKFESLGMAERGTMSSAEFTRWQQSEKGADVPAGIAPQRPAPKAKQTQEKHPVVPHSESRGEKEHEKKLKTKVERERTSWLERRKQRQKERDDLERRGYAERQIAEVESQSAGRVGQAPLKQDTDAATKSDDDFYDRPKQGPRRIFAGRTKGGKKVPVTARSAEHEPKADTIRHPLGFEEGRYRPPKKVEAVEQEQPLVEEGLVEVKPGIFRKAIVRTPQREQRALELPRRAESLEQEVINELPEELKRVGITNLTQEDILWAAEEATKSRVDDILKDKLPPLAAAREHILTALDEAVAMVKARKKTLDEALAESRKKFREEIEKLAGIEKEEKRAYTSPATGQKLSTDMAAETDHQLRRISRDERRKEKVRQNPLLIEMAELWDDYSATSRKRDYDAINAIRLKNIHKLQSRRVAQQIGIEKTREAAEKIYAEKKAKDEEEIQAHMAEWLEQEGVYQQEVEDYVFDLEALNERQKRQTRAEITTPIITKTMRDTPPPAGPGEVTARFRPGATNRKQRTGILHGVELDQAFIKSIAEWAKTWIFETRKALHAAGESKAIGNRISRKDKTPEENVLIFAEQILKDYEKKQEATARDQEDYQKVRKGGKKPPSSKMVIHRGKGMLDLWQAMQYVKPVPNFVAGLKRRLERRRDEALLYGLLVDASGTKAARPDSYNRDMKAEARQDSWLTEQFGEQMPGRTPTMESTGTQMGEQLDRLLREKGFLAPPSKEQLPLGHDPETTTARQAMEKYMQGWKKRGGLTGWQNLMRRALMKSLKKLVGDMPVHFVDSSVIASHGGEQRHGMFLHRPNGQSVILLDKGLKGRPRMLDELLLHEMSHAATAYAIDTNLRGTKNIIRDLMNSLSKTLRDGALTENEAYAFKNEHEFLAQALNNAEAQQMMASLRVPLGVRASIRALGRGRATPSYWDIMVEAVQQAIGLFTPGRAGTSYMDSVLRIYPHVALSSSEQMADAEIRLKGQEIQDLNLGAPFSLNDTLNGARKLFARNSLDRTNAWHKALNVSGLTPTNTILRRVADRGFAGNMNNPASRQGDQLETLQSSIEEAMRPGDQQDNELRRWMLRESGTRREILAETHDLLVNASIDGVDPRKSLADNKQIWDDAAHPTRRPRRGPSLRHVMDSGKRAAHGRYAARWNALPQELRDLLSPRIDTMSKQMEVMEHDSAAAMLDRLLDGNYILPPGMARVDAVKEIMDGKMSPELKAALGKHAGSIAGLGKFSRKGQMYMPAFRSGRYFISGRRNIATPTATRGTVLLDQEALDNRGIHRFVFDNLQDAVDYIVQQGQSGDERIIGRERKYIDPRNGTFVSSKFHEFEADGTEILPQEVYYVTVQDRFMAMSDSMSDLNRLAADLRSQPGEYRLVKSAMLLEQHRDAQDTLPLQLSTMINNIQSLPGMEKAEKALTIEMITNHFIKTQQGNRVTKHMVRREGVAGFATGADELFRSLHTNNEMLSRATVAIKRLPAIAQNKKDMKAFLDALASGHPEALIKLPLDQRAAIRNEYAKGTQEKRLARLSEDFRELNNRIEGTLSPSAKIPFENSLRMLQSWATLNYLGKPIYFAVQALSLVISTIPNMQAEFSRLEGWAGITMALSYLQKGLADVGVFDVLGNSLWEAAAEAKQFVQGFAPREGYLSEGRPTRRVLDYVDHLKAKIDSTGAKYAEAKKRALDYSKAHGGIGQAGLDQPNLRMDQQQPGLKHKAFRGTEQATKIFRALQEGIETINRAAPLLGYVEYYLDKGMDEEQAIRLAHSNMAKEQVVYGKANWARWLSHPVAGTPFMFKKYAAQMGMSYYDSLMRSFDSSDKADQRAAWIHLGSTSVILMVLGGLSGNPLWEPIRYLMYLLGLTKDWDETKSAGEKHMSDLLGGGTFGERVAETVMYGAPRLLNIDVSNRVALDSLLFYRQPVELTKDGWNAVIGQFAVGALGSMGMDAIAQTHGLITGASGDESWPKWISKLPIPGFAKDIFKTADLMTNGPTTSTGVKTGEPMGVLGGLAQMMGIKTRSQARTFEQGSAAQHRHQERVAEEKAALIRRINASGGMSRANMRRVNDWNRANPGKENRITSKSLAHARQRRRETERDIAKENRASM